MPIPYQKGAAIITRSVLRAIVRRQTFVPPPFPESPPPSSTGGAVPVSVRRTPYQQLSSPPAPPSSPPSSPPAPSTLERPTTAETVEELRRRLGKELYRVELDLQAGGRIAGKPCDCLTREKHLGGVEATAEELMSYEANPVYGRVVEWVNKHEGELRPEAIAEKPPSYYQGLTPEVRVLRKAVMGTEKVIALLSPQEQKEVLERAHKEGKDAPQGGPSREL